jgi:molybdenum cofactor cytidylyltransferase
MGSPKLLLPWNGSTVIEHLLTTLARQQIEAVCVVVRPDDVELQSVLNRTSANIIVPDHEPPEMRDSIELGLNAIRERFHPTADDGWLLIPADHPLIEPQVLDGLLQRWSSGDCRALVPKFGERRGHPTLLRWSLAEQVAQLPSHLGINALLRSSPNLVTEWPTDRESVLADLDTPEDYARWQQRLL